MFTSLKWCWTVQVNLKIHGVGILISSSLWTVRATLKLQKGWWCWYHLIPVDSPSQFAVPWGWENSDHLILVVSPSQFEVPWGWEFRYHFFFLWTVSINLKFLGGGNIGITLSSWAVQAKLKFHEGGNFDIILSLWTAQVKLKFHGGGNFDITWSLWKAHVKLKFHGDGNFDIILSLQTVQVNFKFHGVEISISSYPSGKWKSIWSSMGVGISISFFLLVDGLNQFEVPWGWEYWYHLILVGSPSQTEVPWGWEFWYHLILDSANQFEVP